MQSLEHLGASFRVAEVLPGFHGLDIPPGHEVPPGPSQHDTAHRVVELHLGRELGKPGTHLQAQGIAGFRTVEGNEGDAVLNFKGNMVAHGLRVSGGGAGALARGCWRTFPGREGWP